MFTSIELLRASEAMQERVDMVEKMLKRLNPEWRSEYFFPVLAIGLSNVNDDVHWVMERSSVTTNQFEATKRLYIGDRYRQISSIHAVVRDVSMDIPERGKVAYIEEQLRAYNQRIGNLFEEGSDYVWHQNPLMTSAYLMERLATETPNEAPEIPLAVPVETLERMNLVDADVQAAAFEQMLRSAFVALNKKKDWGLNTFELTATGKFAMDRVEARFKGFMAAVEAFKEDPNFLVNLQH
jgi:hypothetical protein